MSTPKKPAEAASSLDGPVDSFDKIAPPVLRPLRVLVADDGRVDRRITSAILERRSHTVVAVGDGKEALEQLKTGQFDAAVLDLQMPEMDGAAVVAALRKHEQGERHTVLVALSGAPAESDWWQGKGIDRYLVKPVDPWLLTAAVESWEDGIDIPKEEQGERVVFDLGEALGRARGKHSLLAELAQIFLEDAASQAEALKEALAVSDIAKIERAAHRLKGSALNVSAQRVADLAGRMEMRVRSGNATAAASLWKSLETEIGWASKALAGFLAQNAAPPAAAP